MKRPHRVTLTLNDEELKAIDYEADHYRVSRARVLRACLYQHAIAGSYNVPELISDESFPKEYRCLCWSAWPQELKRWENND